MTEEEIRELMPETVRRIEAMERENAEQARRITELEQRVRFLEQMAPGHLAG